MVITITGRFVNSTERRDAVAAYEGSIVAVIPARAGSRRLKNKNTLPFGDSNLLVHKIRQLQKVKELDDIVVSSDSDEMLEMAKAEGVSIHRREARFCDEVSEPFGKVVKNICESVDSDNILWATCTCPLVSPEKYAKAIDTYRSMPHSEYDSLLSFEVVKRFLWDENGPINYGIWNRHVRSQDLPNLFQPTFGIVIAPRAKMIEWEYFHGKNPYRFIMDKKSSVDIDDELDLACARAYYRGSQSFKAPFPETKKVYIFSNVYKFSSDDEYLEKLKKFGFEEGAVFVFINTVKHLVHGQEFFQDMDNIVILTRQGNIGKEEVDKLTAENHRIARKAKIWNVYGDDMAFMSRDNEFLFSVSCPEYPEGKDPTTGYLALKMANKLWPEADIELVNFYGNDDSSTHKWKGHAWEYEDSFMRSHGHRRFLSNSKRDEYLAK